MGALDVLSNIIGYEGAMDLSLTLVASTFGVIFVAELPDKTALAALMLATRLPPRAVIFGAALAFAVQTVVAVMAGGLLTLLPATPVRIAAGLGFLVFAFLAIRRHSQDDEQEASELAQSRSRQRAPWLATFLVIFAAEWGDITQLATAALVAQSKQPLSVGLGALLALWAVTILAAYSGARLGKALKPKYLNFASGILFSAIGFFIIYTALQ